MIYELNQLLSIPILFGLIFFASNISEKDRTFAAMACLMLSVFMQKNLPEWAALLHALLGWVFVWAYKGTKEKWFLPVIGIEMAMTAVELFPTVAYKVYSFFPLLSSQLFFSVYALVIGIGVIVSKKLYLRVDRNDREKPVEHEKSYLEGIEHQENGNYEAALNAFSEALKQRPNYREAFLQRGITHMYLKDYERALVDIEKAEALNPQWEFANYYMALTYRELGMYPTALAYIDRAIFLDDYPRYLYMEQGEMLAEIGQDEQALVSFSEELELDDRDFGALHSRALTYIRLQRYDAALADINRAMHILRDDPFFFNTRACLYLHMQDYAHAIKDMNRAIELDREDERCLGDRGEIQLNEIAAVRSGAPGGSTAIDTCSELNADTKEAEGLDAEAIKHLLYENLKIAVQLGDMEDDYLRLPLFQPYLEESPFKELVAEYRINKANEPLYY